MKRYEGRTVAVTGAAQGLGLAMATRFAAEGATVLVADTNHQALAEAAERLGSRVSAHEVDVTDSEIVRAWATAALAEHGRIDVLVNNAGIIRDNRIENISDVDWHAVLNVSLTGTFLCTRALFPAMKEQGYGRIINFSSMSWRGNFGQANYVAAKAGVVGMTRALALEGARHGVTVNAIAPGLIDTPMLASMNAPARDKLIAKVPTCHTGTPRTSPKPPPFWVPMSPATSPASSSTSTAASRSAPPSADRRHRPSGDAQRRAAISSPT